MIGKNMKIRPTLYKPKLFFKQLGAGHRSALSRTCLFGETKKNNAAKKLLFMPPQTKSLCNVASHCFANMEEVTQTNLEHKHA